MAKAKKPARIVGEGPEAKRLSGSEVRPLIYVLSGPNLGRLGKREPHIYGQVTLDEIHAYLTKRAGRAKVDVTCRQSNYEGELIEWVEEAEDNGALGILLNPGALTHTSLALHDAIKGVSLPVIEVHLSNPASREEFRHKSWVAPVCLGTVAGFGARSYGLAFEALLLHLSGTFAGNDS